jgi:hypothetical protein
VQSQGGRLRQICVPQAWQERVRQAVSDYRKMQELIEEVSELSGNDLKKGIANRSPPPDPLRRKDLLPLRDAAGAPGRLQTRAAAFHPRRGQSYSDHALDAPAQPQRALAQISAPRASGYSNARVFDLKLPRQNSSPDRGLCWAAGSASEQCRCAWHDFQSGGSGISGRTESCDGDEELYGQVPRLYEFLLRPVTG